MIIAPKAKTTPKVHCTFALTAALFLVDVADVPESVLDDADESVVVAADPISETPKEDDAASPVGELLT